MVRSRARGPVPRRARAARDCPTSSRGASGRGTGPTLPEPPACPAGRRGRERPRGSRRTPLVASWTGAFRLGRDAGWGGADHRDGPHIRVEPHRRSHGHGLLAAQRTALGQPESGDHRGLQPADERAGGGGRRPHPACDQGVVLMEEQRPRHLARLSPLGEHPIHRHHRPDGDQSTLGSIRRGGYQHRFRDGSDAAAGAGGSPIAQSHRSGFERDRGLAALRPVRFVVQHRWPVAAIGDGVSIANGRGRPFNPIGEPDVHPGRWEQPGA